ncbi:hypothetical protein [Streptomyces sp. NPDC057748]|uniref:hypothetical protein n=1 Tax=unclassified Streptomyces TaxID=2593676 RepID=UPI0036C1FA22
MTPSPPGPLVQALTALWDELRSDTPDLPPVRMAIVTGPQPTRHGQDRWTEDDSGLVSGLVVSTETLTAGPAAVVDVFYHEAAHILAWRRGIRDTTRRDGSYHNKQYLAVAEEIGLTQPPGTPASRVRGFTPVLPDDVRNRHTDAMRGLEAILPSELPLLAPPAPSGKSSPDRQMLQCSCEIPRKLRVSPRVAAKGPILCGVCGQPFTSP